MPFWVRTISLLIAWFFSHASPKLRGWSSYETKRFSALQIAAILFVWKGLSSVWVREKSADLDPWPLPGFLGQWLLNDCQTHLNTFAFSPIPLFIRKVTYFHGYPFTPKSFQLQISPAASPETLHHTVWRIWLFIPCNSMRDAWNSHHLTHTLFFKGWEDERMYFLNLGVKGLILPMMQWIHLREIDLPCCNNLM